MLDTITIRILGSGSSGNCAFVRIGRTRLLIDAGISCRRITRALAEIDETIADLDAILVTHEHSDHVKGLKTLLSKYPDTRVFATRGTMIGSERYIESFETWSTIRAESPFEVGEVRAHPFKLSHDANEPTGFRLDADGFSMAFATDLGVWNNTILEHLTDCRVLILEANHDLHMLRTGPYPPYLQKRVASSRGHLSNEQARALLSRIPQPRPERIILAHLSQKNNTSEMAVAEVKKALEPDDDARIIAAAPTPGAPIELPRRAAPPKPAPTPAQGTLFLDV
jgi:phosphoribosyl 1,2-cyclic phosphodiesterase